MHSAKLLTYSGVCLGERCIVGRYGTALCGRTIDQWGGAEGTDDLVGADKVDGAMPPSLAVGGDPVLCGRWVSIKLFDVSCLTFMSDWNDELFSYPEEIEDEELGHSFREVTDQDNQVTDQDNQTPD